MKNRVSLSLGFNTRIKIIADYTTSPSEPLGIGVGLGPHLFSLSLAYASESSHLPLCLWHQTSIKTQRILFLDVITYPDPWHPSFLAHSLRLKWEIVTWLLSVARMVAFCCQDGGHDSQNLWWREAARPLEMGLWFCNLTPQKCNYLFTCSCSERTGLGNWEYLWKTSFPVVNYQKQTNKQTDKQTSL